MNGLLLICLYVTLAIGTPLNLPQPRGFEHMGKLSQSLGRRQFDYDVTRNELSECKAVTLIYARGTIELGNVGSITGPPFFNALDVLLGSDKLAVQGVDYPATILGYLEGGDVGGGQKLADLTNQAASQCPDTQIVLSGYSQGAQVVHLGASTISSEAAAKVAAIVCSHAAFRKSRMLISQVLFGDPKKDQPFPNVDGSKVKTFCFNEDLICDATPVVDSYHLSYAVDAIPAAQFVKSHVHV
ncbi:uncharacterized protein KY384_001916 [Bacidia gigantensis]|uniref:uncharacterized protein n=1 Tax=Bacidia gigantensis TaxID=2732470 RepID=UPI001D039D8C|nr:uncharacterized protein KY384_001916 [Bacidia gigantensis]KAG8533133.1 hypothetical protein KY384_001916 [Bacidia gigantensis]